MQTLFDYRFRQCASMTDDFIGLLSRTFARPASRSIHESNRCRFHSTTRDQTSPDQTTPPNVILFRIKLTLPGKRAQYVRLSTTLHLPYITNPSEPTIRQRHPRTRRQAKDVSLIPHISVLIPAPSRVSVAACRPTFSG